MIDHLYTIMSEVAQDKKPYTILASSYNVHDAARNSHRASRKIGVSVSEQKLAKLEANSTKNGRGG